jgi:hypothetical protein
VANRSTAPAIPVLEKKFELSIDAQSFDAKVERVHRIRVDQDRRDPGAPQQCCRNQAGEAAADNGNAGVFDWRILARERYFCAGNDKYKGLVRTRALKGSLGKELFLVLPG